MSALLKRYRMFLVLSGASIALTLLAPDIGWTALSITKENTLEMLSFLPPIFILLGLLDVWIDRETMMKYMGNGSGMRGGLLAFILGSAAAGPLYAAFPIVQSPYPVPIKLRVFPQLLCGYSLPIVLQKEMAAAPQEHCGDGAGYTGFASQQ
jgi:uncharacterized membrane protein YraQ (UPF0718 family)